MLILRSLQALLRDERIFSIFSFSFFISLNNGAAVPNRIARLTTIRVSDDRCFNHPLPPPPARAPSLGLGENSAPAYIGTRTTPTEHTSPSRLPALACASCTDPCISTYQVSIHNIFFIFIYTARVLLLRFELYAAPFLNVRPAPSAPPPRYW